MTAHGFARQDFKFGARPAGAGANSNRVHGRRGERGKRCRIGSGVI
jgi:hypothetical protein